MRKSILLTLLLPALILLGCEQQPRDDRLNRALGDNDIEGFQRALTPRPFKFPRDHAAHPEYKNEWWYFTGNLTADDGQRFGYQVTFFRIALTPNPPLRRSNWATNQIWMAHAAVTHLDSGRHLHAERFSRGAVGLAGNTLSPLAVWLDDWRMQANGDTFPWQLKVETEQFSLSLQVTPEKDIVLQGDRGLSQKSAEPGNASYYYSITRMTTTGEIGLDNRLYRVSGSSWLDREWGTSLLAEDQQGWDWFSLQFDSGEEMMFYQLRKGDGSSHPNSLGSWVGSGGMQHTISPQDIELTPLAWWRGPDGADYPIRWRVRLKSKPQEWIVQAAISDQLMDVAVKYWEGAVLIFDASGKTELGRGYLEMTGY